jgi:peptide/nickel transport system ATP-binding protein
VTTQTANTAMGRDTIQPVALRVRDLRVHYHTPRGAVKAVDGVSFDLAAGERLGLVGESGSGKSTIALALMRMIKPPGMIEGGQVLLEGTDLLAQTPEQMRQLRLAGIAMIAQGAMNSLNPVRRVRDQILDAFADHGQPLGRGEGEDRVAALLTSVGLNASAAKLYPHELSGGMKQRVVTAIAISLRPKVIIADEPTSALDVVVQRQIMQTLLHVQEDLGAAVILIGHDMGLMAQFVTRLGVMYSGKLVELCPARSMFTEPLMPYSQLLIASLPSLTKKDELRGIPGLPPSLLDRPSGCAFRARCPYAFERCAVEEPALLERRPAHWAACHLLDGERG